jgi:hypothetical protein
MAAKQCCHLMEKEFIWLIVGHFNQVLGHGILSSFSGLFHENWYEWSPYMLTLQNADLNIALTIVLQ